MAIGPVIWLAVTMKVVLNPFAVIVPFEFLSEVINSAILARPLEGTWLGKTSQNSFPLFEKSWAVTRVAVVANKTINRDGNKHDFLIECRASFRYDEFTEKLLPKFIDSDNAFAICRGDLHKG